MEVRIIDTAEICQGAVRPRTLLGVPTSVGMALLIFTVLIVYLLGLSWWSVIVSGIALLVYGWLKFQTKRDPHWIGAWWDHVQQPDVYEA